MRRASLGKLATTTRLARFLDDRIQAGEPRDLFGTAEAARLPDLGEQVTGEDRPDAVDRLQCLAALVTVGEAAQLRVDGGDLRLQRRHHRQQ